MNLGLMARSLALATALVALPVTACNKTAEAPPAAGTDTAAPAPAPAGDTAPTTPEAPAADAAPTAPAADAAAAAPAASPYAMENTPENLTGLLKEIVRASNAGETAKAAALTKALLPDEAAIGKALKDDAPAELKKGLAEQLVRMGSATEEQLAKALVPPPERTEVTAHGATTEEIQAYADGSVAFKEFPGGARKLAETALRPGVTFYEVEFTEPGKDMGMKYHLFFWDGAAWRMLGPAWRGLPQ